MAHILILGAGYGGLPTAQRLVELGAVQQGDTIQVVDRNTYHTLVPRLHEAAAATLQLNDVIVPYTKVLNTRHVQLTQANIQHIDLEARKVITNSDTLAYDTLVIALGSVTNFYNIPGLEQHSLTLKNYEDAQSIRNNVEQIFQLATHEPDVERRRELLTFVIGGGGFTGVQMAGELADWSDELAARYRIDRAEVRIIIVEMMAQIMPGFRSDLVDKAAHVLEHKRIELRLNTAVERLEAPSNHGRLVTLKQNGVAQTIRAGLMIWTGGVRAPALLAETGLQVGPAGRVLVNEYLQAQQHPEVFVLGDSALVIDPQSTRPVATTAQFALLEAGFVAHNVLAFLHHGQMQPFKLSSKGIVVGLGRHHAVGLLGAIPVTGYPAFLLKQATEARWLNIIGGPGLVISRTIGPKAKSSARTVQPTR